MTLAGFNQKYEEIIHSNSSSSNKDRKLADLMSELEAKFKIPALRKDGECHGREIING
ncbi:MAG: hypothetical protein ACQEWV_26465 [Bacillota bacterium]